MKLRLWLLALVVPLASCSYLQPHECLLVGAESGVSFDLSALASELVTMRACVQDACQDVDVDVVQHGRVFVANHELRGNAPASLRLVVTDAATGKVRSDVTGTVPLRVFQPNGPDCAPTAYQGQVRASPDGQLIPT